MMADGSPWYLHLRSSLLGYRVVIFEVARCWCHVMISVFRGVESDC